MIRPCLIGRDPTNRRQLTIRNVGENWRRFEFATLLREAHMIGELRRSTSSAAAGGEIAGLRVGFRSVPEYPGSCRVILPASIHQVNRLVVDHAATVLISHQGIAV